MKPRRDLTKIVTPPAVRHWPGAFAIFSFGPAIAVLVAGLFDSRIVFDVMTSHNGLVYVPGYLVWIGLWVVVMKWRERRLVRRVIESDRQVCPRCTYDLRGLPNEHKCPECGSTFELEVVRSTWLHWWPVARSSDPARKRKRLTRFLIITAIMYGRGLMRRPPQ